MSTGPEQEARLAALEQEVRAAREAEAHRRIRRHRAVALLALVAVIAVVVLIVAALTGAGSSGEGGAAPSTTATTSTSAAPTTTEPAIRPAIAPPTGTTPDPASLLVLVDRQRRLPPGWAPPDLVDTKLPFAFTGPSPKRMLRAEAAGAVDRLSFAAAADGVAVMGVSGFRSEQSQQEVYESYVGNEGEAAANTFSAKAGHSEHQTGLAIDLMGIDGTCPAEPCFGETPQAAWLVEHADEFGFIIRYPEGKEEVTTYQAEPWHLRYVGVPAAKAMVAGGMTLEEYLRAA